MVEETKGGIGSVTPEQIQEAENNALEAMGQNTPTKTDIEKLEAQISQLEADGSAIYVTAIQALKDERQELITKAEAEAKKANTKVVTVETSFREKYGNIIVNGIEIAGIGAIVWRMFFF